MPFEKPLWVIMANKLPGAVLGEEMTPDEKAYMPDWIKWRGGYLAGRKGKQPLYGAGLGLSIFDVYSKMWPGRWWEEGMGSLSPNIRIPLETLSGKYFFMDAKIIDRHNIYTPAMATALKALNPAWRALKERDFVHKQVAKDGTAYWVVPAPVVYLINQIRPINDVMKALDPRLYGQGWMTEAQWLSTGMREYPVDLESEKLRRQRDRYEKELRGLASQGMIGYANIPYIVKGIETNPETKAQVDKIMARYKSIQKAQKAQRGK